MWLENILIQTYFASATFIVGVIVLPRLYFVDKLILIVVASNILIDIYTTYLSYQHINTMFFNSVFTSYEQALILYIYSYFKNEKIYKTGLLILCVGLIQFSVYNLTSLQGVNRFNTFTFVPTALIIAVLSYFNVRQLIISENLVFQKTSFWFSVANFQYYIIVAPVMSAVLWANEISINLGVSLKQINNISYCIWAILIAIGFLCQKKKTI